MATPVVTVASGGLPVVDVTASTPKMGLPVTEALAGRGMAVTKVAARGMPVTYSTVADYPPPVSTFTPTNLTGLIGWWDASVTASLILSGADVLSIADQSGAGNTASWNNAKPVYSATGFNISKPAIIIQPRTVAGLLRVSNFPMGTGNTLTCWYMGTFGGDVFFGTNDGRVLSYAAPSQPDFNNVGSWCVTKPGSGTTQMQFTRNATAGLANCTTLSPHRIIVTVDPSGVQAIYVNGVATAGATVAGNWVSGGNFSIGSSGGGGAFWDGSINQCGVATAWHPPAVISQLDDYLKVKGGM